MLTAANWEGETPPDAADIPLCRTETFLSRMPPQSPCFWCSARAQPQHPLHPFELPHPVRQRRRHLVRIRRADRNRTRRPQLLPRQRPIPRKRPIPRDRAHLRILRRQDHHRNTVPAIDLHPRAQVLMLIPVQQPQVNLRRIRFPRSSASTDTAARSPRTRSRSPRGSSSRV